MPLSAGTRLGPYEILAPLGAGGMGEVYRARDTKLKRDVALKVLPDAFASDPARMARFQREAEVLASLNHPNIAHLNGIEERALVMELVEGQTLPCPLPVETALAYAKQIADALEYAHEKGVVHRDLKPANIKITPDGVVKVLDFGLAKAIDDPLPSTDPSNSPTLTLGATRVGMILGTAAYMSPEQASGHQADRRADIWSFGAVLYEMLAGQRAFPGESAADTLATVMKLDPDWEAIPKDTPVAIQKLLRRCLTKDRKHRLQAIGEARIALENPGRDLPATVTATAPSRSRLSWVLTAVSILAAAALAFVHFREPKEESRTIKLLVPPPENATAIGLVMVSPDGRRVAFVAAISGKNSIWVRDVDSLTARPLAGTEGGMPLAWSPDSRFLAFSTAAPDRKLKKIDLASGSVLTIFDARDSIIREASWGNGVIVFLQQTSIGLGIGLMRIPETGGTPTQVTAINTAAGEGGHFSPWFLPDGRHFLYTADNRDR